MGYDEKDLHLSLSILIIVNIQLDESTIIKLLIYSYKEEAYLDN